MGVGDKPGAAVDHDVPGAEGHELPGAGYARNVGADLQLRNQAIGGNTAQAIVKHITAGRDDTDPQQTMIDLQDLNQSDRAQYARANADAVDDVETLGRNEDAGEGKEAELNAYRQADNDKAK